MLLLLHEIIKKILDDEEVYEWDSNHFKVIDVKTDVNKLAKSLIRQHKKRTEFKELIKQGMENKMVNRVILFLLHWNSWESSNLWKECDRGASFPESKMKGVGGNHVGLLFVDIQYSIEIL
ncbi:unnamed protein product [Allacma fusca]|uniref:Uncharacterized protein n=1 Tax=Allacma fusca TaxID=39272 RepID=A0A8J2PGQ2_9HEXA|nr:unnamed protein product [Allacma fusca]